MASQATRDDAVAVGVVVYVVLDTVHDIDPVLCQDYVHPSFVVTGGVNGY